MDENKGALTTSCSCLHTDRIKLAARAPEPVDIEVGIKIRQRRKMAGLSQTRLATELGITFQQIQKYEKGSNRVSASRLQDIANALSMRVSDFFTVDAEASPSPLPTDLVAFLSSSEGIQLNRAFVRVSEPKVRRRLIDLIRVLGTKEATDGSPT